MDYSVGSLSDLITGSDTPNKLKVVRKRIKKEHDVSMPQASPKPKYKKTPLKTKIKTDVSMDDVSTPQESPKPKYKKTPLKTKIKTDISMDDVSTPQESPKPKYKKTPLKTKIKSDVSMDDVSTPQDSPEPKNRKTPLQSKIKREKGVVSVEKVAKKRKLQDPDGPSPKKPKHGAKKQQRKLTPEQMAENARIRADPEMIAKTVFVGNLPKSENTKKLALFFGNIGKIEAIRMRGITRVKPTLSRELADMKAASLNRHSLYAYVRFADRESAVKATEMNGVLYRGHHLVIHSDLTDKKDETKAIFIGNLDFFAEEEDLWKLFESCGPIESVRIVRDKKTRVGKGFAYINFKNSDSVTLALEMENVKLRDRVLRITMSDRTSALKVKKVRKIKPNKFSQGIKFVGKKKFQRNKFNKPGKPRQIKAAGDGDEPESNERKPWVHGNKSFQGNKFAGKKEFQKNKFNKPGKPKQMKAEGNGDTPESNEGKPQSFQGIKFAGKKEFQKNKFNKPGKPKQMKAGGNGESPESNEGKPQVNGNKPFQGIKFAGKKEFQKNKFNKPGIPKQMIAERNTPESNEGKPQVNENKSFQGVKFVGKKKFQKNKLNKGLLQKKKLAKKIAPK